MSLKDYIINTTEKLIPKIDNNTFEDHKLNINDIKEDYDISKLLENDEGHLGICVPKKINIKTFIKNCYNVYNDNEYYKTFNNYFKNELKDNNKYKIANIFLILLIVELDYEEKIQRSFEKYVNNNAATFEKTKASNKEFFEKYYGAKFFSERAKSLIIANKSLLNSIKLMIEHYNDDNEQKKKDTILNFILSQTYNKMFNIDYLWILYTYGYRAPKTFNSNDTGFSPFPTDILKDYYI